MDASPDASPRDASPRRPGPREVLLALAVLLVLAAWPTRETLLDPGRVASALDAASVQLPWSAAIPLPPGTRAQNPDLADQATQHYPLYRWVSRSWRSGDPPLWNPSIYAGAPGVGNAQAGVVDPRILGLVLFEVLGGLSLFHWGLGALAWLHYAAALWGAYLLGRRLGLAPAGAALAAATFGFCGYDTLWLHHPLGRVPPLLPWVLLGLEGTRGRRPFRAAGGAAAALALAILAGHAETAFYVGAAAGLWAVGIAREDRRAGLLGLAALAVGTLVSAVGLVPLGEYLSLSAARAVRAAEARELGVDLVALGLVLVVSGLGVAFVRTVGSRAEERPAVGWGLGAVGLALAVTASAYVLAGRGLGVHAALALVPDRLGSPGDGAGGYRGEFNYIEVASAWVALVSLGLALAAALSPPGRGTLRGRRLLLALAGAAFLLAIELPGLLDLYRRVPLVGLGATVRMAPVGALAIGLLAGEALQSAPRPSRVAAALVLAPLVAGALLPGGPPALAPEVAVEAEQDELLGFVLVPERQLAGENSPLELWLHPGVAADAARVRVELVDASGAVLPTPTRYEVPLAWFPEPSPRARASNGTAVALAPEGARWLRTPYLLTSLLPEGHWRFVVDLFDGAGDEPIASRRVAVATLARVVERRAPTLFLIAAGLACVLLARGRGAWVAVAVALAAGLHFARGVNPVVPEEHVFPPTETEALLAAELGPHRFFSDPQVLPPNTGLVRGLAAIDGYDAMDVASFNEYRQHLLPPGVNPLLAWNPRGIDLGHPLFRLLGVGMLALGEPLEHPDWELVAAPAGAGAAVAREAETWLYRARDPLPRAFCVSEVLTLDELGERLRTGAFDPLAAASLAEGWRPAAPFAQASVGVPVWTNNTVSLEAALDGDGLLVLTEQHFPGWKVYVDGERRPLLRANTIFRAVALGPGEHRVVFRYEPGSVRAGAALSALGLLGLLGFFGLALRQRPSP